jgi:hypothetical protein
VQKRAYFDSQRRFDWPSLKELEAYFLAPPGKEWFYTGGNDGARLVVEGLYGTEHLEFGKGRVDADLMMWGNPDLGVQLIYSKYGGGYKDTFASKGDLTRLQEWVRSLHDTPLPVGLFIPFRKPGSRSRSSSKPTVSCRKASSGLPTVIYHPTRFLILDRVRGDSRISSRR